MKIDGRYFKLPYRIAHSVAFRRLSLAARVAFDELGLRYNGSNNGGIVMPSRYLGERMNVDRSTASRALTELVTAGLVEVTRPSAFTTKTRLAACYRFVHLHCDVTGKRGTWPKLESVKNSNVIYLERDHAECLS
jgi:MarR family